MRVQQDTINNLFSLNNTVFIIPVYQRNYAWSEENCKKLLEDIISISKTNSTHFMGTITYILHYKQEGFQSHQEYVIIDGQQRITTIMLLLKALETKIKDEYIKIDIKRFINIHENNTKLRLKPIEKDRENFSLIMRDQYKEAHPSKIKSNYIFLLKEIEKYQAEGYQAEEIYGAFLRLKIVGIGLEKEDDDPQVVFESINATGVRLEGVDLIRNFLMMDKDYENQEKLFTNYWKKIEEHLGLEKDIEAFIIDFLRMFFPDVKKDHYYFKFKELVREKFKNNVENIMQEMCKYARIYKIFIRDDGAINHPNLSQKEEAQAKKHIKTIANLKFGVAYPFIMQIINDFEEGKIDFQNFYGIIKTLISYYIRRMICGEQTAALNKVCYVLYKNLSKDNALSLKGLQYFLGQKTGREIFPNDERVKRSFININAYSLRAVDFILLEIEKLTNKEAPDAHKLSIEHFYPQTPTKQWRNFVGEGYENLEQNYKDTFGNLTLTAQNSKLSNKSFEEKITLLQENGSLHLNDYFINNIKKWDVDEIIKRGEFLAGEFCKVDLFKDLPIESRKPPIRISMDDNLSEIFITDIILPNGDKEICNNKYPVLIDTIIKYLLNHHKSILIKFINTEKPSFIRNKSEEQDQNSSVRIYDDFIFQYSPNNIERIRLNLNRMIKFCNLHPKDFLITIEE